MISDRNNAWNKLALQISREEREKMWAKEWCKACHGKGYTRPWYLFWLTTFCRLCDGNGYITRKVPDPPSLNLRGVRVRRRFEPTVAVQKEKRRVADDTHDPIIFGPSINDFAHNPNPEQFDGKGGQFGGAGASGSWNESNDVPQKNPLETLPEPPYRSESVDSGSDNSRSTENDSRADYSGSISNESSISDGSGGSDSSGSGSDSGSSGSSGGNSE